MAWAILVAPAGRGSPRPGPPFRAAAPVQAGTRVTLPAARVEPAPGVGPTRRTSVTAVPPIRRRVGRQKEAPIPTPDSGTMVSRATPDNRRVLGGEPDGRPTMAPPEVAAGVGRPPLERLRPPRLPGVQVAEAAPVPATRQRHTQLRVPPRVAQERPRRVVRDTATVRPPEATP